MHPGKTQAHPHTLEAALASLGSRALACLWEMGKAMAKAQDRRQNENTYNPTRHFQSEQWDSWGQCVCFFEAFDRKLFS